MRLGQTKTVLGCFALVLSSSSAMAAGYTAELSAAPMATSSAAWNLTPELGISAVTYKDVYTEDVHQTAMLLRANFDYRLKSAGWSVGANAYSSLGSMADNLPLINGTQTQSLRVYGYDGHAAYKTSLGRGNVNLKLIGGLASRGMSVTDDAFGLRPLVGLQLYPEISLPLEDGGEVSGYFRYLPLTNDLLDPFMSIREITAGATYRFRGFTDEPNSSVRAEFASQRANLSVADASLDVFSLTVAQSF